MAAPIKALETSIAFKVRSVMDLDLERKVENREPAAAGDDLETRGALSHEREAKNGSL